MIGFGQAKAADAFPGRQRGQVFVLLFLAAIGEDGVHHQAALHGNKGAKAGVAAFQFLHNQAIGHVVQARAAVAVDIGAEHPELGQLGRELNRKALLSMVFGDHRQETLRHPVAYGVAGEFFVL